jgi:thioredoxin 1
MENCTVCPFIRYWYIVIALIVVVWAVNKFLQSKKTPLVHDIAGVADLTMANFERTIASGITLVDFWAPWCGPCKMQLPIIAETVSELPEGVTIAKVNVDEAGDLAKQFEVRGIPTWIVFKDGKEIARASGVQSRDNILGLAKKE